jgi:alpha-ribazole phosphatase
MRLWIARHARPLVAPGICYGSSDVKADEQGTLDTAHRLALSLPEHLPVFCSPLTRCLQLADALAALRPDLLVVQDTRLREMDFGHWEGHAWADIPQAAMAAWTDDFNDHRFGGAESVRELMQRVGACLSDTRRTVEDSTHQESLWISHAGVARAASLLAQGIEVLQKAEQWPKEAPDFGQAMTLRFQ